MENSNYISDEALNKLIEAINSYYPDWKGFKDERFVKDETEYMRKASAVAKELLDKSELKKLRDDGNFDEIIKRIEKVGHSTNLLYLSTPKTGDLGILYKDNLDKVSFCNIFFEFLYGEKPLQFRFSDYIHYVKQNSLPNKWVFPTYFLYLLFPESEIFIKPITIKGFLNLINSNVNWSATPEPNFYNEIKNIAVEFFNKLEKYEPTDMIDIHSFLWVAINLPSGDKIEKYLKEYSLEADAWLEKRKNDALKYYDFFQSFINREKLQNADWSYFQELGNNINAFTTYPLTKTKALGRPNHPIEFYRQSFLYLVYGDDNIETRIKNFIENDKYKLKQFGHSSLSEIVGYIFAEDYVLFNARDKFALDFLGMGIRKKKGDTFTDLFLKYNERIKQLKKKYIEIVGRRTQYPVNLEIDQFFNYLYEKYSKINIDEKETIDKEQINYWQISPGEKARLWEDFKENNIIAIRWDSLGNLSIYDTLESFKSRMKEVYGEESSYVHDGLACYEFVYKIKIGDIVIAKQGTKRLLGYGKVLSDYYFDDNRKEYKNCRDVEWYRVGEWDVTGIARFVTKTLTNITKYPGFAEMLLNIINEEKVTTDVNTFNPRDIINELFIEELDLKNILQLLKYKKNLILQGPPGVGKTFIAKRIAYLMMEYKNDERIQMIQFHQSYSYEDFIQGYKPTEQGGFELKNGIFYEFCKKAQADSNSQYFFIIDEINRGNLSKIFGEVMMLIEKDKRGSDFALPLTYSKSEKFFIPENLYFIGTMNTADRSLAMVDYALRRRFAFITLKPAFDNNKFREELEGNNIESVVINKIIERMNNLNKKIAEDTKNLGPGYQIGHSYFCPDKNLADGSSSEWYNQIIHNEIEPLLNEYWFDNPDKVKDSVMDLLSE